MQVYEIRAERGTETIWMEAKTIEDALSIAQGYLLTGYEVSLGYRDGR